VGKIAEKAVYRRVFLTIWHCSLSTELTKNALLQTVFLGLFCPLANTIIRYLLFKYTDCKKTVNNSGFTDKKTGFVLFCLLLLTFEFERANTLSTCDMPYLYKTIFGTRYQVLTIHCNRQTGDSFPNNKKEITGFNLEFFWIYYRKWIYFSI